MFAIHPKPWTHWIFKHRIEGLFSYSKNLISPIILQEVRYEPMLYPTALRLSHQYSLWYTNMCRFCITVIVPLIALLFFNYRIYKGITTRPRNNARIVSNRRAPGTSNESPGVGGAPTTSSTHVRRRFHFSFFFPWLFKADIHAEYVLRIFYRIWTSYVVKYFVYFVFLVC